MYRPCPYCFPLMRQSRIRIFPSHILAIPALGSIHFKSNTFRGQSQICLVVWENSTNWNWSWSCGLWVTGRWTFYLPFDLYNFGKNIVKNIVRKWFLCYTLHDPPPPPTTKVYSPLPKVNYCSPTQTAEPSPVTLLSVNVAIHETITMYIIHAYNNWFNKNTHFAAARLNCIAFTKIYQNTVGGGGGLKAVSCICL